MMPEKPVKLAVQGVQKSFGGLRVLDGINLELYDHETVCLLGASGTGKTTLFNIVSGLLSPDEGRVLLNGSEITGNPGRISYMLQKDLLLPYRTVLDNAALPLMIKKWKKTEARAEAAKYFDEFGLSGTEKKYPSQLSGGMRQRAALLRTYLFGHGVVLLDEPFSALDAITKSSMHQWFLKVMEQLLLSTLFITHDVDEAILLSDRICILAGKPGIITHVLQLEAPKRREPGFMLTGEFLEYKRKILNLLGL